MSLHTGDVRGNSYHSAYSAEGSKGAGIPEGLVHISVGLENSEDIIADFHQAFAQVSFFLETEKTQAR